MLLLILLTGCASRTEERRPAAIRPVISNFEVDTKRSKVQIFPAVADQNGIWYYFYVQLKNSDGHYIDSQDLELKTNQGQKIDFHIKRSLVGRYYLTLEKSAGLSSAHLNLFAQGKVLREEFKLNFDYPSRNQSKIILMEKNSESSVYRLHLRNEHGENVSLRENPEIILDGLGVVEDLRQISEGVWEFSVIYPEENTIMYFSVRAMGVELPKLFRYQHVEK